tara:strand:- start:227 stop:514 length:288 start_codon:yes stop_codon:yes gene_type:complete
MATTMAAVGASTQQVMAMGRWKSHDMPARYTAQWAPALAGASTVFDQLSAKGMAGGKFLVPLKSFSLREKRQNLGTTRPLSSRGFSPSNFFQVIV